MGGGGGWERKHHFVRFSDFAGVSFWQQQRESRYVKTIRSGLRQDPQNFWFSELVSRRIIWEDDLVVFAAKVSNSYEFK
jgi:hypothetical protein